nr:DUF771 domain-containing protein [Lactobacillus jensenii]
MDLINKKSLQELIRATFMEMKPRLEEELTGRTIDIDQFRKEYCGGKSASWVRTFIFDAFPETNYENGGWCMFPHRTAGARKTIILVKQASEWMEKNRRRIDWSKQEELK